jgi:hypothetical protein
MSAASGYRQDIMDATGASEEEAAVVEGIMRDDNRGILSDLTERQFDKQARANYEALKAMQSLFTDQEYAEVVAYYRGRGA